MGIDKKIGKIAKKAAKAVGEEVLDHGRDIVTERAVKALSDAATSSKTVRDDITVTETADATAVVVEKPTVAVKASKAADGPLGNISGVVLILGSLLMVPEFAQQLATFTVGLARGEGGWGALAALVGAGLLAYRHRPVA